MAKRGRKPKEKSKYFGEKEEAVVVEFLNCKDEKKRNILFNTVLLPALSTMTESIIRRYKYYIPDEVYEDTFTDTLSFLMTKMEKYDPDKKYRAYSYYQTVIKNYLLARLLKYSKNLLRYPPYDEAPEDISNSIRYSNEVSRGKMIASETVEKLIEKIGNMLEDETLELKETEKKLGAALKNLLENWDFVLSTDKSTKLNKNAILLFLRDSTGLDTKGVRDNMKKFKNVFAEIKKNVIEAY